MSASAVRALQETLARWPQAHWWVAFSGGTDSLALASLVRTVRMSELARVTLLHVDHGLHVDSGNWAMQAAAMANTLQLAFSRKCVHVNGGGGEEAAARDARYAALSEDMRPGDVVLTAHHQEDQAETLLLRLLRGAGTDGLAAMAPHRPFAQGWLVRPLLETSKAELATIAAATSLASLTDPANLDERYDRVFLRERVLPLLREHWPGASAVIARAASHQREAAELLHERAKSLSTATRGSRASLLSRHRLAELAPRDARLVLRHWLAMGQSQPLSTKRLEELWRQLCAAERAAIRVGDSVVRVYRDDVYLTAAALPSFLPASGWLPLAPHDCAIGQLRAEAVQGAGLAARLVPAHGLHLAPPASGERCEFGGHGQHRPLKKMFQSWRVPAWQRPQMPMVRLGDELVAVPNYFCNPRFAARPDEAGWLFFWEPK